MSQILKVQPEARAVVVASGAATGGKEMEMFANISCSAFPGSSENVPVSKNEECEPARPTHLYDRAFRK